MHHIWRSTRIRVKKIKQILPDNYLKRTKIVFTACTFSKFSGGGCSRTPLELFLFLNQLQICSAEKNMFEKYVKIMAPLLQIFSLRHWFQCCFFSMNQFLIKYLTSSEIAFIMFFALTFFSEANTTFKYKECT